MNETIKQIIADQISEAIHSLNHAAKLLEAIRTK